MLALDRAQQGSVQFKFQKNLATSAGRKAGRLSTNTAQSVDTLSTDKAYLNLIMKMTFQPILTVTTATYIIIEEYMIRNRRIS